MSILERMLDRSGARAVTVDPMRVRHIGDVLEIERTASPRPWSVQVFHDELREARTGRRRYVVARRGRDVVGYGGLMFVVDEAHITNIAVREDERRRGVASSMLAALARAAIDRGCESWTLEVRATSAGAQHLYRSFGFAPAGVRKNYYEAGVDAIVMWCHDIQSSVYSARLQELAR
ncbi:ribosomal protein S18-alanine N-acetyltransferase [soil metagenome]